MGKKHNSDKKHTIDRCFPTPGSFFEEWDRTRIREAFKDDPSTYALHSCQQLSICFEGSGRSTMRCPTRMVDYQGTTLLYSDNPSLGDASNLGVVRKPTASRTSETQRKTVLCMTISRRNRHIGEEIVEYGRKDRIASNRIINAIARGLEHRIPVNLSMYLFDENSKYYLPSVVDFVEKQGLSAELIARAELVQDFIASPEKAQEPTPEYQPNATENAGV